MGLSLSYFPLKQSKNAMKLVLIAFLIAIFNQEVSYGQFFGPIKIGPGITLMSRPMNYEPNNGPEIVIPDSDTWTPAAGEWPKCEGIVECGRHFKRKCRCNKSKPIAESYEVEDNGPEKAIDPIPENKVLELLKKNNVPDCEGTVVCRLKGSTRYCKCRKSIPTLAMSEESPIPDSEVKHVMEADQIPESDIPGKNWVKGKVGTGSKTPIKHHPHPEPSFPRALYVDDVIPGFNWKEGKLGTGSKTTVKHHPHPEPSFPSDFCQRSGWKLIFKGTQHYWSNFGAINGNYNQQCPPIAWYGDTCEPFEDVHMRYYPCPGWRDNRYLWCHVNPYGRFSCKSIYGWKRKFGYLHHG